MKKIILICLTLFLTACSANKPQNAPNTAIEYNLNKYQEEIILHINISKIYEEYMKAGFFPQDTPRFNIAEQYFEVQAQDVGDTCTILFEVKDNQLVVNSYFYTLSVPFTYDRHGKKTKAKVNYTISSRSSEIEYVLIAQNKTYKMWYESECDCFYNSETGNQFEFLPDLQNKLLKIYKYHELLSAQLIKNQVALYNNVKLILEEKEPTYTYDTTSIGFGDYVLEIQ